jgi:hypothetical protein
MHLNEVNAFIIRHRSVPVKAVISLTSPPKAKGQTQKAGRLGFDD